MSFTRACIIGVIIGCSLYAAFILTYKKVDAESMQHLRQDVRSTIESKLDMLHLHPTSSAPVSSGQVDAERIAPAIQPPVTRHNEQIPSQSHAQNEGFNAPPSLSEVFHNLVKPAATTAPTTLRARTPEEATCRSYLEKYAVIPGVSWGTLPSELQKSWKLLKCDDLVRSDIDTVVQAVEEQQQQQPVAPVVPEQTSKKNGKKGKKLSKPAGIVDAGKDNKEWCHEVKAKYNVVPMRSWGQLPMNYVETWRGRRCDLIFTTERMGARPLSSCPDASGGGKGAVHSNLRDDLPLIAVMAATTTRKITKPSTQNLSLFMYLLPSLVRTLDCGFRYEYVMGYDKGDPFYDSNEGMAEVQKWFKDHVEDPMRKNGIRVTLRLVKVNNTIKKPGPVFLEMARAAYGDGASYFYRINDDTELMVNWARKYVDGLSTLTEPYGVVGPLCNQGNEKILTHDFTHRLHMEIFEMNYYPPELTDWWMDDWISLVYGKQRTFKARGVPVMHHTGTHGTRYAVDSANGARLTSLVEAGRKKIRQYMLTHNVPEHVLKDFDNDKYQSFTHLDLPTRSV